MKRLCIVGTGYVGLVTGACFAEFGNDVTCLDVDASKIEALRRGHIPIYEPGLASLVSSNLASDRLRFTTSYAEGMASADLVFIAVGTPALPSGEADLSFVASAARSIAANLDHDLIVVDKSTVPVGTGEVVARLIEEHKRGSARFAVVSNPEFLREGSAVQDCFHPDRVVLGGNDPSACRAVAELYASLGCPIVITDLPTAEMIKYASNAMLATRISFINEMAALCEHVGADVKVVARGMGLDTRIGPSFLEAGLGYGGSCFPKDVKALIQMAVRNDCHPELLRAVEDINGSQRERAVAKLRALLHGLRGRSIGLLGLAFKPGTDDMREAPAIDIARDLLAEGASVAGYDPVAGQNAAALIPGLRLCDDIYQLATRADALVIVTEWPEFRDLDLARLKAVMRQPLILDGRNVYDGSTLRTAGFVYCGSGRDVAALQGREYRDRWRPHRRSSDRTHVGADRNTRAGSPTTGGRPAAYAGVRRRRP